MVDYRGPFYSEDSMVSKEKKHSSKLNIYYSCIVFKKRLYIFSNLESDNLFSIYVLRCAATKDTGFEESLLQ